MGVIHNREGLRNHIDDAPTEYDGKIAIELRGSTSQHFFPKKPYRIETQDDTGENLNVSLFGMPKENDWILYNPYSDKTFLRNILAYQISTNLGHYASRWQPVEVILNQVYMGVYIFILFKSADKFRIFAEMSEYS